MMYLIVIAILSMPLVALVAAQINDKKAVKIRTKEYLKYHRDNNDMLKYWSRK